MSDVDTVNAGRAGIAKARLGTSGPVWQVNTRGRKVVEMSLPELAKSVKAGKLGGKTLVWCEGMPAWTPLGEVPELARIALDSEPPTSGARLIVDEVEPLAGTKSYVSTGSEPPTDPGTLAIYERPLATIEFPDVIEAAPESVDEPTPAFGATLGENPRITLPGLAPEDLIPLPSSTRGAAAVEPPAPPLPPRVQAGFPAPVTASPLGAALSSMARSNPNATPLPAARSKQHDVTSYAVAKATPIPSTEALQQALSAADEAATSTPRPHLAPAPQKAPATSSAVNKPTAAANIAVQKPATPSSPTLQKAFAPNGPAVFAPNAVAPSTSASKPPAPSAGALKPFASTVISAEPPKPVVPGSGAAPAVKVTTVTARDAAPEGSSAAPSNKLPSVLMPRPAIEFLPPIIVQEKEDDGASIITLPLDANFHESTLVLAGRRRQRRWVPLGAAIAAAVGSACLASALTALMVNSRTPATRVVEKRVLVPIAAPAAAAPEAPAPRAASAVATAVATAPAERPAPNAETPRPVVAERTASRSETSGAAAKPWRKDDPGALEQSPSSSARRERAGFPTNPGF